MDFLILIPLALALLVNGQDYEDDHYGKFKVKTMVFNAFPSMNSTAFVLFEENRINRLAYGEVAVIEALLERHSDFIIQFRTVPKEDVIGDYTDYGFMEGELTAHMEVVLVLRRKTEQLSKPQHDLLTFTHKVEPDFSKLFVYNAVWNNLEMEKGLNVYGLYKRKNYDGSESESISQLAVDVPMNEGRELELQPGTDMTIKAFYSTINSVSEFKLSDSVASLEEYSALAGKRRYLLVYGDYQHTDSKVQARLLEQNSNSASAIAKRVVTLVSVAVTTATVLVL